MRKETLDATVISFETMGIAIFGENERDSYISNKKNQKRIRDVFVDAAHKLANGVPPSLMGVLGLSQARFHPTVFKAMGALVGVMNRKEWDAAFGEPDKSMREIWKWWGTYTAMVVPAWDENEVVGAFLLTQLGERYLPLCSRSGVGFSDAVSAMDEVAVIVDDVLVATRFNLWAANEHTPMRFVVPYGARDNIKTYQAKRTVLWSTKKQIRWLLRGLGNTQAQIYTGEIFRALDPRTQYPASLSANALRSQFIASPPVHKGLADLLLKLPPDQARVEVTGSAISADDRARITRSVQGEDCVHLERILVENVVSPVIKWNEDTITEQFDGWYCAGKKISAAILRLETQQQLSGDLMITGSIVCDKHSFQFKERYTVIAKNPGNWLRTFLIARGKTPYIEASWNSRIYEIARRFHEPVPVTSASYGWNQGTLLFPNFCVDATRIYPTQGGLLGPQLGIPSELSPAEWDAFKSQGFCRIFLVLLHGLLRAKTELPPQGIILCNEPNIVERLASAFGVGMIQNPKSPELDLAATNPLPLFASWTEAGLRDILNYPGHKNIIVSVDSHTAKLATIMSDWTRLDIGTTIDYCALRAIFLIIPGLLKEGRMAIDPDKPFRSLADIVDAWVLEHGKIKTMAKVAGFDIDTARRSSQTNSASKIMGLIHYGVTRGEINPVYKPTEVVVSHEEFTLATSSAVVSVPGPRQLTAKLIEAKFLVGESPKAWRFGIDAWNLNKMLAMTIDLSG